MRNFDERDNQTQLAYFGVHGEAIADNGGVAFYVYEYDLSGREIVRRLLNAGHKPVKGFDSGRSIIRSDYDGRGLKTMESSFDEFDHPVDRTDEHWSVKQWLYDANGQLTKTVLRDKSGNEIPPPKSN